MNEQKVAQQGNDALETSNRGYSRRKFLGMAGLLAGAGIVTLGTSCNQSDNNKITPVDPNPTPNPDMGVDLGKDDAGILNYAYALEQLEAAFYARVVSSFYTNASDKEKNVLNDIAQHELAHAKFFKKAITDAGLVPIQDLTPDFSKIDFTDRMSVLTTAQTFEDLGVSAYNGAGKLIKSAVYLGLAGKIVSVEARHAAAIRDLISNGSFADLATLQGLGASDAKGLDAMLMPAQVLAMAGAFIKEKINFSNLPTD